MSGSEQEQEQDQECNKSGTSKKIQRTVESMMKLMEVSNDEIKYRMKNFDNVDIVKEYLKYLKCTKCNQNFKHIIQKGESVSIHPLLGVLMCKSCCDYYGDGNFSLDSEGEDKYCRWCGEGGTIFACSKCICGFCNVCIKKHFGESGLEAVENDDDWVCYFCNPKPLWCLRSICFFAKEAAKNKTELKKVKSSRKKRRRKEKTNDSNLTSSDSCNSGNSSIKKQIRPKRHSKLKEKDKKVPGDSTSSEDEKENHVVAKRKLFPEKTQDQDESIEIDEKNPKKKPKMDTEEPSTSEFETKKSLLLERLTSIWKLTQTVSEVGLTSSKQRLKHLSDVKSINGENDLKTELENVKYCMRVLMTSLNAASTSLDSVKEDFTFDSAKDEREIFQSHENELKKYGHKLQDEEKTTEKEATLEPNHDDGDDASLKERQSKQPVETSNESTDSAEDKTKNSNDKGNPLSESGSEKENAEHEKRDENKENRDSADENSPVKPRLKVKSFARMLDENVYDKNKEKNESSPVVIDLYDIETEESESEAQEVTKKSVGGSPGKKKSPRKSKKAVDKPESVTGEKVSPKKSEKKKENCDEEEEKTKEKSPEEKDKETESHNENERKSSGSESEDKKENQDTSDEEDLRELRKKRSKKADKKELKATFEKFKRKRERFLKSSQTKDTQENGKEEEKEEVAASKLLESSESEGEKKENERKAKKRILASSDEENGGRVQAVTDSTDEEGSEKENQKEKSDSEVPKHSDGDTSSDDELNVKSRMRIKGNETDSSEDDGKVSDKKTVDESSGEEDDTKKKKGRKNIKKILKKDSLKVETKEALRNEIERKKRVKERQKLFEELFPDDKQIVLDFDPETKEPLVRVHKKLVKKLKPHQVKGVRFMWDNCFESVKRLEEDSGSGCILAHCMGLGKTLQVITLVHTVMTHDLGVHTVLIVCPLSTVSNWIREFEMWLANVHTHPIVLYDLVKYKKQEERRFHLEDWHKNGGVLVLSYDMFRNLTKDTPKKGKRKKKYLELFEKTLLDPGPDLIVCDEGHLLKNEGTALSKCISRVKTSRRIVLTGTPLQNNLIEYHCMVQFVKPNILGTKKEFCNRFVNPINNGQFEDSTDFDVRVMKRRSHVLHSMLEGCIQRFDYSVLTPFLPEKREYVLSIALTKTQAKAYVHFINNISARSSGNAKVASLFNDYHNLQRIWTHPKTLLMQSQREIEKELYKSDSEGSLKDFVVSSSAEETEESSDSSVGNVAPKKRLLRSNAKDPEMRKEIEEEPQAAGKRWWDSFYDEASFEDLRESNKLVVLFALLKHCEELKDKVLVFSQSLYSLDLIEYFLWKINDNTKKNDETLCGYKGTWVPGSDYFRLDGSTTSETRAMWCKYFNKESNTRARLFLISTRAGGLGINLYGANRVVIFDASWNPSHDLQSIFRVYRFGQKKTCYIYRFLAEATMEEKIYERQVTKLSLAHRVVDEHQIERHYTMGNLQELYTFEPTPKSGRKVPKLPKDSVLADLLTQHKNAIVKYHEHDSLLENKQEEELTEEERKAAWKEYEDEKIQKTLTVNAGVQSQVMIQLPQSAPGIRIVGGPTYVGQFEPTQNYINPMYIQTNIPLEVLQRGLQVGVPPVLNETLDSYVQRIINREAWIQPGQFQ